MYGHACSIESWIAMQRSQGNLILSESEDRMWYAVFKITWDWDNSLDMLVVLKAEFYGQELMETSAYFIQGKSISKWTRISWSNIAS